MRPIYKQRVYCPACKKLVSPILESGPPLKSLCPKCRQTLYIWNGRAWLSPGVKSATE